MAKRTRERLDAPVGERAYDLCMTRAFHGEWPGTWNFQPEKWPELWRGLVLALDPGPEVTGWVILNVGTAQVLYAGEDANPAVGAHLLWAADQYTGRTGEDPELVPLVIEGLSCFGARVGQSVFETARWIGLFEEAYHGFGGQVAGRIFRPEVKLALTGATRAKDADVRRALLSIQWPGPRGGGAEPLVGTKKKPGPLYKVRGHAWSALAVAVAWAVHGYSVVDLDGGFYGEMFRGGKDASK